MPVDTQRRGDKITITTYNPYNTYSYQAKIYEKPNGKEIAVPKCELSELARKELEKVVTEIQEKPPEKYKFQSPFSPTEKHKGKFKILEKREKENLRVISTKLTVEN